MKQIYKNTHQEKKKIKETWGFFMVRDLKQRLRHFLFSVMLSCVCAFMEVCVSTMCWDKQALCSIVHSLSSAGCEGPSGQQAQHTD